LRSGLRAESFAVGGIAIMPGMMPGVSPPDNDR
jgi:hypothetical protein